MSGLLLASGLDLESKNIVINEDAYGATDQIYISSIEGCLNNVELE